jgi:hypothetical protein
MFCRSVFELEISYGSLHPPYYHPPSTNYKHIWEILSFISHLLNHSDDAESELTNKPLFSKNVFLWWCITAWNVTWWFYQQKYSGSVLYSIRIWHQTMQPMCLKYDKHTDEFHYDVPNILIKVSKLPFLLCVKFNTTIHIKYTTCIYRVFLKRANNLTLSCHVLRQQSRGLKLICSTL